MRTLLSSAPGKLLAVLLAVGAILTTVNTTTGFWDSQVEHDSPQTVIAEIVLDASGDMNQPIAPSQDRMETKWSAARQSVLAYTARQYASPNTYVALRYFAGPCPTNPLDREQLPVVDWPDTRYFLGPWQISGGTDNQREIRTTLESVQPADGAPIWAATEAAIAHLRSSAAQLEKATRKLVVIYSSTTVDTCQQFSLDRLVTEAKAENIILEPISLGEVRKTPGPNSANDQLAELASRLGRQVSHAASPAQLDQALATALPAPTLTPTPMPPVVSTPSAAPPVASTPSAAATDRPEPTAASTPRTVRSTRTSAPTPPPASTAVAPATRTAIATSPSPATPTRTPSPAATPTPTPTRVVSATPSPSATATASPGAAPRPPA
jgi:hypothetical protein